MDKEYRDDEPKKDLGTQGHEDTLKGKLKEVGGKIQSKAGELTGDRRTEGEGHAKQFEGKTQSTVGKGEKKLDDVLDPDK